MKKTDAKTNNKTNSKTNDKISNKTSNKTDDKININYSIKLNNGLKMPILGLGVYQSRPGDETENAVLDALEAGYRHIDTAAYYRNEESVGNAVRKSKIPRDQIFITTKLKNDDHHDPETALNKSLKNLGMEYVDLYLIHWPVEKVRLNSWKILEKLCKEGKCRAIGVSNFTIRHLKELLANSKIVPAVNQVEFHPFLYQKELMEFCRSNGIALEAYSPLTQGKKLGDKTLIGIAKKYDKSPAQIMIRWCIEHDVIVIPKSVHKERIIENSEVFDFKISEADMKKLDSLNENLHICWNPETID